MFTRPRQYHPYKPSKPPVSSAGFRIMDYVKPRRCFNLQGLNFTNASSPAPSPLNSPTKGPSHPDDDHDAPPTVHLADLLAKDVETPAHPSTPAPDRWNARPKVKKANVPAQDPLPNPPRRNVKRGPKHLSINGDVNRSGVFLPHRRAQQMRVKRSAVHNNRKHNLARTRRGLKKLRREAEALMKPEHMNNEDTIFLKQLAKLELTEAMDQDLEECREQMARARAETAQRRLEHKKRDKEAAKRWATRTCKDAWKDQKKIVDAFVQAEDDRRAVHYERMEEAGLRFDEERRRAHEALERQIREEQERLLRQELARKAKEEKEERRRQEKRARELQLRMERERRMKEMRERQQREEMQRKLREEAERQRKAAQERRFQEEMECLAREERERQARLFAEQARHASQQDEKIHQYFVTYEAKWNELRTNNSLPPIDVRLIPWPVFGVVSSVDQITEKDVKTFLFHPQRPGFGGKTARDKVKSEVLRFHPDKFNTRILPKIQQDHQEVARAIAGAVARILTRIMTEEAEGQK